MLIIDLRRDILNINKIKLIQNKLICFSIILFISNVYGNSLTSYAESIDEKSGLWDIENIALIIEDKELPSNSGGKEIALCVFDNKHSKVKLLSISRDTYVESPNGEATKIGVLSDTASKRYIIDTINNNFNLKVSEYAKIDLIKLINTVVSIQCVTVDIREEEVYYMKSYGIVSSATHNLTPSQALAFTRISGVEVGGRERSDRIRIVLAKCFEVIKKQPRENYLSLIYQLIPCIESNICSSSMVKIGMNVLSNATYNLGEQRIPFDNSRKKQRLGENTYWTYDKKYTKQALHDYIYNDILPGCSN